MMFDLTPVVQLVISLTIAILTRYAVPILKEWKSREQLERLWHYAAIAVRAAEQMYGAGAGKEKAEYVQRFLSDRGFTVSADEIKAALEAAVQSLNEAIMEEPAVTE